MIGEHVVTFVAISFNYAKNSNALFDFLDTVISTIPYVGTVLGFIIKIYIGKKSNLQIDNISISICNTQEIRDIPNMICLSSEGKRLRKRDIEKIDVGLLEMYKANVNITFTGDGVDDIALFFITKFHITFANNNTSCKYREVELVRDETGKKTGIKWRRKTFFRERNNKGGVFVLNAFLLIFRPRYAKKYSYANTADFFCEMNDAMKISVNFFSIKNTGNHLYYTSGDIELKQKKDEAGNIYWESYNE